MALDYRNIGNVLDSQGDHDRALQYHRKALKTHQELNDRVEMAGDYRNIGVVYFYQGNYGEALDHYNKALAIHQVLQDRVEMSKDYVNIGNVLLGTKEPKLQLTHFIGGWKHLNR